MLDHKMFNQTIDEISLQDAINGADFRYLLMSLITLTGETSYLDRLLKYNVSDMKDVPTGFEEEIRRTLFSKLRHYSNDGNPPAPALSVDTLKRMMELCAGEAVPDEYVPMLIEEMRLDASDRQPASWHEADAAGAQKYKVAIVGAGLSGLCAAIKLKEAGIPFTILEKNSDIGGTWFENIYPGCGVDTPNHFYSYSFARKYPWSRYYSKRDEIYKYINDVSVQSGIRENVSFNTQVLSAKYDDNRSRWSIVAQSNGEITKIEATFVIFATGMLNIPSIPDFPGLSAFRGPAFHTARWDPSVPLKGRRVGMIGCGASGVQVGPSIATEVERLSVFQRSPHWVMPSPNYHRLVEKEVGFAVQFIPFYESWYRFHLFWSTSDGILASLHVDPDWPLLPQSLNEANERMRQDLLRHIAKELSDRPDLIDKVTPKYPPYGKRMVRDNHWYQTLKRDNVDLVSSPIASITSDGVVTRDGDTHPVDVLIFATGFKTSDMLAPIDIRGKKGVSLRDRWDGDNPRAYLGITIPDFPNLFLLYGPGTALAHGGSTIFIIECQVRHVVDCIIEMAKSGKSSIECRYDAYQAYNDEFDRKHEKMVWANSGARNWYRNRRGRVFANMPYRMVDYWELTRKVDPKSYTLK